MADEAFAGGDYAAPPEAGLRAFGRVYAGWAYSQAFYRELGFETWEEGYIIPCKKVINAYHPSKTSLRGARRMGERMANHQVTCVHWTQYGGETLRWERLRTLSLRHGLRRFEAPPTTSLEGALRRCQALCESSCFTRQAPVATAALERTPSRKPFNEGRLPSEDRPRAGAPCPLCQHARDRCRCLGHVGAERGPRPGHAARQPDIQRPTERVHAFASASDFDHYDES